MVSPVKSYEFEGETVEKAIQRAVSSLNVSRETISIRVVCEEQKGLFGMEGAKTAKIKVTLKPASQGGAIRVPPGGSAIKQKKT